MVVATLTRLLSTPAVASADPEAPQPGTPCASNLSDVMTWPPADKIAAGVPGQQWQAVTTPQPPNDRWLSFGPPMTLHGEGLRNPNVASGDWTATPQDANSQLPRRSNKRLSAQESSVRRKWRKAS